MYKNRGPRRRRTAEAACSVGFSAQGRRRLTTGQKVAREMTRRTGDEIGAALGKSIGGKTGESLGRSVFRSIIGGFLKR